MDKKEAILRIKDHMEHHGIGKYPHLKLKKALDMAIAALDTSNEPLTCEGCIHEHNEHENCNYCKRASYLGDYYYRRPPEGET